MKKTNILFSLFFLNFCYSQDSLRGSLNENRSWWNVLKYAIEITPFIESRTISGKNTISYSSIETEKKELQPIKKMQIDLQYPMQIDSVIFKNNALKFYKYKNVYHIENAPTGQNEIVIYFSGKPKPATNAPWNGGWVWEKDKKNRPFISVACQGLGASVWYPCKDHQSDEPDQGASITIHCPKGLTAISNGKLINLDTTKQLSSFTWNVSNPINNYNIVPTIGNFVHWQETFDGEKGKLPLDFWVLDYELEKARKQFSQTKKMLTCFENWFGPYPFYEDGYKIVQTPFLGMEHQSAIAYGNNFKNGYLGTDLSRTGWGLDWDYILIHESGHEWFGNNITASDIADMWIHEGFTTYSEVLFVEYLHGEKAGNQYMKGLMKNIDNDINITGEYGINSQGSGDMYSKGAALVHMIRQLINDDKKFKKLLRTLNSTFEKKTISSATLETFISEFTGINFCFIFEQYLRTTKIPVLELKFTNQEISYKWTNCSVNFDMPLPISKNNWIYPTTTWKKGQKKISFNYATNFLFTLKKVSKINPSLINY